MDNLKSDSGIYRESKNICGRRIRQIRRSMCKSGGIRMTQDDLAAKLQLRGGDFVRLTINRIENGRREVTDYELVQIADVLGVDLNTLVCGKLTVSEMAKRISDRTLLKEDSGGTEFGQNNNGDENIFAAEGK